MDQEFRLKHQRSKDAEDLIHELRMQIQASRSSQFNRALLKYIEENPNFSIRESWEDVENHFATQSGVSPRPYPFEFEN